MSIIQDVDLVTYQLRSNYLSTIKDGVGERLITINDSFLNRPGFKYAGWRANPQTRQRTHSPPIPTAITSEYFRAPRAAGLPSVNIEDENEENGLVTGGNAESTFGPGLKVKRRRREQMEEDDSSDLSDDSDEDDQRAAQAIKFAKMPVRLRSGSSPMRKEKQDSSLLTSPARKGRVRRGSQSTVEAIKERARRGTATSSEISSDNDFDNSAFKAKQAQMDAQRDAAEIGHGIAPIARQQSDLLPEELEDDSDGSYLSSAFAGSIDSQSMLSAMRLSTSASANAPASQTLSKKPPSSSSPKKAKSIAPNTLPALPPPRPISFVLPKSLLSAAIKAKRTKAALPFETFQSLSGQGDPNPLRLRIWAPFAKNPPPYYEVLIRRMVHDDSGDRQVTVADLIGLSLWRYTEEKKEPAFTENQLNVNCWTLRMIEDEEVDFDFPPLDRTKPVVGFCTANARAGRSRGGSKTFDEFALVEATPEQLAENKARTPQFLQESVAVPADDEFPVAAPKPASVPSLNTPVPPGLVHRVNPLLTTVAKPHNLADTPAPTIRDPTARPGVQKLLRIHIHSSDAAPGQMLTIDVSTGTYLAEVLDIVCKKRGLDKAAHVLKLTGSGAVVLLDRTVGSIGQASDLDLWRRRFGTDGVAGISGSPSSPRTPIGAGSFDPPVVGKGKKKSPFSSTLLASAGGVHPLAREQKLDERGSTAGYRKWTVWRKQPMRFVAMNERVVAVDGEYLHIMPGPTAKGGKGGGGEGKTTTVHFSNVVGCKVVRRHPTNFKVGVWRGSEPKHYEFEAKNAAEAAEIVEEIKKGIAPYNV